MGWFERFRGGHDAVSAEFEAPADRDASNGFWFSDVGRRARAGVNVSVARARRVPVVRDCLQVLATTISGLSIGVFERTGHDSREKRREHPVARLLADPNPAETSFEFLANMVDDLASEGRFLAEHGFEGEREVLWRIHPDHFTVERLADRRRRFRVTEPGRGERILTEDEVWYVPLPPLRDAVHGRSPILDDGVEAIGAAIALQDYANDFFRNDATPRTIFLHKGNFRAEEDKKRFLSSWSRWFGGSNRHRPGVLEYGMTPHQLSIDNEKSQFLETRRETWLDVARLWRMPPHKVGILDKATFSNIEHQGLEFVTDTIGPWLELIERSVNKWLIADGRFYFEFNVSSLLRGDIKARFEAYAQARQWGWLSVNEIRRLENMNGIGGGGDRYLEPLNMGVVGEIREPGNQTDRAIAFLRQSVARNGGRPKLEVVRDAA